MFFFGFLDQKEPDIYRIRHLYQKCILSGREKKKYIAERFSHTTVIRDQLVGLFRFSRSKNEPDITGYDIYTKKYDFLSGREKYKAERFSHITVMRDQLV